MLCKTHVQQLHETLNVTWTEHVGVYGEIEPEPSYSVEIVTDNPVDPFGVRVFVDVVKTLEHQASVMVELNTLVNVKFM